MLIYWMMFWFPLLGAISPKKMAGKQARTVFVLVCAFFALIMGLRHEVGGDWFNYLPMFDYFGALDFEGSLEFRDPGYSLLTWFVAQQGGSIYVANLICAALMMIGVERFCRSLPNPWLALLVAVPYMLIVVGMGYTRQAVALGAVMYGLVYLGNERILPFVLCVAFGATFHSSAVLLIPIAGLAASKQRAWTALWVAAAFIVAYVVLLQAQQDELWENYVTHQETLTNSQHSYGALERSLMNAVAAVLLLLYRRRFVEEFQTRRLWIIFCWLALGCLPLVSVASTAVDRMALYLLPLQLFVFSRMPNLTRSASARTTIVVAIVAYYALVEFVWLNFAVMKDYWVPYHFMPFD